MNNTLAYYITLLRKDFTDYCNETLKEMGLSQGQLFFILYVGRHPDCSPKELAQALHMDTGHVTRSLMKLEQGGFLSQECDERDHRAHILHLKEKGERAFAVSHELFARWDNEAMAGMEASGQRQIKSLLEEIVLRRAGR